MVNHTYSSVNCFINAVDEQEVHRLCFSSRFQQAFFSARCGRRSLEVDDYKN